LTASGAAATVDALSLGASDYVTKAANAGSLDRSMERLRLELIPKIKQFFHPRAKEKQASRSSVSLPKLTLPAAAMVGRLSRPERQVLVIGSLTGGPNALAVVLKGLRKDFRLPVLVAQHMPPMFTRLLAERLSASSGLRVEEATEGSRLEAGKVLIAPGDYHMEVRRTGVGVVAALNQNAPEHSCRPAVDVLFRSVAQVYGGSVVALVLTGMGCDGAIGAADLQKRGAYIIAQDEASSVVWGMPGAVVKAGVAHAEVSLDGAAAEILRQL
jgi:two-component system, chemotaxis family, protein-glutamate methylesterase/glutaminase